MMLHNLNLLIILLYTVYLPEDYYHLEVLGQVVVAIQNVVVNLLMIYLIISHMGNMGNMTLIMRSLLSDLHSYLNFLYNR